MTLRVSVLFGLLALMVACSGKGTPVSPTANAAVPLASSAGVTSAISTVAPRVSEAQSLQDVLVNMQDACDPETFNATLGPDTCVGSGGVQFNQFIGELTRLGFVGPWHFSPPTSNVQVGQSFVALNKGGEVHTFTEVAQFGGGIVPSLNQLAHVPTVAPECTALEADDFVAPGTTYREDVEHAGTLKFQCCIHPWMRLEAQSSSR
jgi:plastocyanin